MLGLRRHAVWIAAGLLACVLGSVALARLELLRLREQFDTDMRIAHRLLSQRVVQHDAILATLALLQPAVQGDPPEQRLPSLYPQILALQRRDGAAPWPQPRLQAAEQASIASKHAELAGIELAAGRYELVLAAQPASFAMRMDLRAVVPWTEWPMAPQSSPVRVTLEHAGQSFLLQPGEAGGVGWRFGFEKHLASESQPFDVVGARAVGPGELPWRWMALWCAAVVAVLAIMRGWLAQREGRRRAEDLLRLGQVSRLNALGELAAGMAHELNQPLTAVLANTQAATRLLAEEPPELQTARDAMAHAAQQARRASEVVARLRRSLERADPGSGARPVVLQEALRNALYLVEPELQRRGVQVAVNAPPTPVTVLAESVALEQVVHNLLVNALQALDLAPVGRRQLELAVSSDARFGMLEVADTGPGIAAADLPRLFEPFFTTREHGLGLGLSLCESLALGMGGRLTAENRDRGGAAFRLSLPLAP